MLCMSCTKNHEPRHLFIKKLYFGLFQTFKAYMYIYIYTTHIYIPIIYTYTHIYIYICVCVCCCLFKTVCLSGVLPGKFFILPPVGFVISPVRNLLLGLTSENFLEFDTFLCDSSSTHRGTETGCYNDL